MVGGRGGFGGGVFIAGVFVSLFTPLWRGPTLLGSSLDFYCCALGAGFLFGMERHLLPTACGGECVEPGFWGSLRMGACLGGYLGSEESRLQR